ncbi:hypothetical protein [Pseudarthrobacter sp. H2]|uniref:hypothetical protein n=1 Tax=Pseudarthrobacter sp. H2 TaxID=3418415 RepID=UPI003CF60F46
MSIDVIQSEWSCELKEQDKPTTVVDDETRVEVIRGLCQGAPFLQLSGESVPAFVLDAFGVEDERVFISLLKRSLDLMVNGPHKEAIESALGRYYGYETLTLRRNHFLEGRDISYRTLVRHEQEGAAKLASLMMKIKDREVPDAPDSSANLHHLEQRIADLETLVAGLARFSYDLLKMVEAGKPLDANALRTGMTSHVMPGDEHSRQVFFDAEARVSDRAFNFAMALRDEKDG